MSAHYPPIGPSPRVAPPSDEVGAAETRFADVVLGLSLDVGSYAEQRAVRDALDAVAAAAVRRGGRATP